MSDKQVSVNNSDLDLKKKEETRVSNWLIAGTLGAVAAVAVAGTVYYVKSQRKKELQAYRYGNQEYHTVESYKEKMGRYWNFARSAFTAVQSVVSDFLTSKKDAPAGPLITALQSKNSKQFQSDAEVPDVLEEEATL